jgi:hypothetical protein
MAAPSTILQAVFIYDAYCLARDASHEKQHDCQAFEAKLFHRVGHVANGVALTLLRQFVARG